ncbi:phospholipase D-like domain-containing protein [Halorussus aquaticus]|uniref:Phosphatidylserine/phosphatidylglycerophosphate/ cardiolipin synthase family protein n=1 Tax=Halorussus aquaticus TaxID=2953748 RepID=A0ABD5PYD0_9EURY|nr:phospholipase D-like domain-containing protein [Halorussus aquaticus]
MSLWTDFTPIIVAAALIAVVTVTTPPAVAVNTPAETTLDDATTGNDAPVDIAPTDPPEIVALYPNPVADGDAGEFAVVRFPQRANPSNWSLADGETTVAFPNETVSGRVAVSGDPRTARNLTDAPVIALTGGLSLANGGETVRLVRDGTVARTSETDVNATAATVTYEDAPEGERFHRVRSGDDRGGPEARDSGGSSVWRWTPLGATDFGVARTGPTNARAFVLPDSPAVPLETLRRADRRILLAGYTFASERVADALASATRRGVEVRVLVDGAPVGGLSRRSAKLLDSLVARGVEVRVLGGPRARYDFHHAKYAVADDRALVLTENWKPSGTGGHSNRGWGAVVRSDAVASRLAEVFRADAGWRGATPWSEFRRGRSFDPADGAPANDTYPAAVAPDGVNVSSSEVLVAPDNAEASLVSTLDAADESIRVQQVAIGGRKHSLLRATLRAARRGVEVRVLLSSAWYVEKDNRKLVEWLNSRAEAEGLSLEARMADPRGRYGKIHAKGVVVDGDTAVVGSLNWNNHSARANREVAVVLRGEEAGGFYARAFDADWRASADDGFGSGGRVPVGLLGAVAVGAVVALLYAKREVVFEN